MGIGKRIKEAREFLGLTQEELSRMVSVTKAAIGNYETGVSHPKEIVLYKLFEALSCDANFLFQDEIKRSDSEFKYSSQENLLIKKYRALDERGKITVDKCLNEQYGFIEQDQSIKEETATIITHPAFCREKVTQTVNVMDGEMDDEIKAELREYAEELMAAKYGKTSVLSENIEKGKDLS